MHRMEVKWEKAPSQNCSCSSHCPCLLIKSRACLETIWKCKSFPLKAALRVGEGKPPGVRKHWKVLKSCSVAACSSLLPYTPQRLWKPQRKPFDCTVFEKCKHFLVLHFLPSLHVFSLHLQSFSIMTCYRILCVISLLELLPQIHFLRLPCNDLVLLASIFLCLIFLAGF